MIEYNIGIVGAGDMAGVTAETLNNMNGICPYAIASRDLAKAEAFAKKYNIPKWYGSYEELFEDPDVELVYIATVNSTHVDIAKKALDAGKPVFIEKPFSYNAATAKELLDYAESKDLYCGEAMWLRFNPLMRNIADQLKKGVIGDVRTIYATTGYRVGNKERLVKPELGGGAILDVGIYPITAVLMMMGNPIQIVSDPMVTNTGVDAYSTVIMKYPQGRDAIITISMLSNYDNSCTVYGTHGRVEIDNVVNPAKIIVYGPDGQPKEQLTASREEFNGYEYEFKAAREAAIVGNLENKENPRASIINTLKIIDTYRYLWNTVFPLPGEPEKRQAPQKDKPEEPPTQNA